MNQNKSLGFLGLGILLVLTLLTFASAVPAISSPTPATLSQSSGSFTVTVTDSATETVNFAASSTTPDANGKVITTSLDVTSFSFNSSQTSKIVTVSYIVPSNFVFESGKIYSITFTANAVSQTISFVATNEPTDISSCKLTKASANTSADNIDVTIDDVSTSSGFGSDTTFYPLDNVEVKVTVDNSRTGTNDMRSVIVRWALYDSGTQRVLMHEKLKSFSLDSGDEKSLKITFKLDDPALFNRNTGPYTLYVWANAEDKETSVATCNSDLQSVDVNIDNNFVVLDSLQAQGTIECGSSTQVTGTVWNIGDSDEEGIYIMAVNADLGISQRIDVGDINSLDSKDLSFSVKIPDSAESGKTYLLAMTVYDSDGNIYENDNNDQAKFYLNLLATGTCTNQLPVTVSATLESAAKAGQEIDVQAVITNTASSTQTFNVDLSNYADWASLISIDKTTVTLNSGASQTVLIKLQANKDVSGDQNFDIVLKQGAKTISQSVSVPIEGTPSGGFDLGGIFGGLGGNTYLWIIGALNVLLVLIIIIVAVRVVRKK